MNFLGAVQNDPGLARLDREGQELAVALAEVLTKGHRANHEVSPLLKSIAELTKADPDPDDRHISTELSDLSIGFFQTDGAFFASNKGNIPVAHKNDKVRVWDKGDLFRDDAQARPRATESAGGAVGKTTADYVCERYAWHHDIDDESLANESVGDPRLSATRTVAQKLMIRSDALWVEKIFKTGIWTTDLDGVAGAPGANQFQQWDQAASDPRGDFTTRAVDIHERSGVWPNVGTLSPRVLVKLLVHPDVNEAFKYTTAGAIPSLQGLAESLFALGVAQAPTLTVAGGVKTTSAKGAAADTFAYIAGKHALLAYVPPDPGLDIPSAYYTFSWEDEMFGTNENGVVIRDFERPALRVPHRIEGEIFRDVVLMAADLGAFFEDAVA